MSRGTPSRVVALAVALTALVVGACALAAASTSVAAAPRLADWPEFGLNPQRTDATDDRPGSPPRTSRQLRAAHRGAARAPPTTPPIYLHGARRRSAPHVVFVTTTYGITLAIDAGSGRSSGGSRRPATPPWRAAAQITTATPVADPGGATSTPTSPDGLVHKLAIATARGVRLADAGDAAPDTEKLDRCAQHRRRRPARDHGRLHRRHAALRRPHRRDLARRAATSIASSTRSARTRTTIIVPSTCPASDSAILSRSGPVVEPGASARADRDRQRGPTTATTDFGDSVIELTLPGLTLRAGLHAERTRRS